jgi:hypothetical protein
MTKRILILAGVLTTGMIIFGLVGAGAWFSHTVTSDGNIIIAGTLDLQVSGGPLKATDLVPGTDYSEMGNFCTKNTGTTDLKFRGLFEASEHASQDLIKFMTMKVEQKTPGDWSTMEELLGSPQIQTDGLPAYFKVPGQDPKIENKFVVDGILTPGQEICYRLSVKLDGSTPNSLQDSSLDFILHLFATQTNDPSWE